MTLRIRFSTADIHLKANRKTIKTDVPVISSKIQQRLYHCRGRETKNALIISEENPY